MGEKKAGLESSINLKKTTIDPKCLIWIIELWHFQTIFVILKVTCLVTLRFSKNRQNEPFLAFLTNFCNVARFARNIKCDFSCDFQTPCLICFVELYNNWSIWLVTLYQTKNQRTWIGCKTGLDGVSRRLQPPSWKSDRIHAKLGRVSVEVGCSASENRNLKRLFFDRKVDQVSRFRNYNFQFFLDEWPRPKVWIFALKTNWYIFQIVCVYDQMFSLVF